MFPRDMRPFFLAQRGRCPYCVDVLVIESVGQANFMKKADRRRQEAKRASWDHVFPKSRWGNSKGSKVICHTSCNQRKSDRHPYACEVLFRDVTVGIVSEIEAAVAMARA